MRLFSTFPYRTLGSALSLVAGLGACSAGSEEGPPSPVGVAPPDVVDGNLCNDGNCADQGDPDANVVTRGGPGNLILGDTSPESGGIGPSDKIDLLFVVDNSSSMADKQQVFSEAIPDLLKRLVNPPCIDPSTGDSVQPESADEVCSEGFARQFAPVKDIHVGIVTSSLGAHGADSPFNGCESSSSDKGYMVGALPRGADTPSYKGLGFLAWDPEQSVDDQGFTDLNSLTDGFLGLLGAVGEEGCGYEAPLEAMYRFLMDPMPHASLERVACNDLDRDGCVQRVGVDTALLEQRAEFLRPDSVVAVVMLADEDDCSVRDSDIGWLNIDEFQGVTRASSACEADPNDACCRSCAHAPAAGCLTNEEDAACVLGKTMAPEDEILVGGANLRCVDQKRKYGFDYLYPVSRYVLGFTSEWLPEGFNQQGEPFRDEDGNVKFLRNPLYSEPVGPNNAIRDASSVFFVGIVGVPWQDVATAETVDVTGQLDLIAAKDFESTQFWERVLGDPKNGVLPLDPFAVESESPRTGINPVTDDAIMPPDSVEFNAINGKERTVRGDLQYSCIFELPETRDCALAPTGAACDCRPQPPPESPEETPVPFLGNPLCWDATAETYSSTQRFAKAYPAPRILSVLKGIGPQAVVSSICPKNMTDDSTRDFGYRPVVGTFIQQAARILLK